ncbi:cryptochrome [Dothidotthia symphoricarpi CBS 119687]|uniref:Cryptochrome DASH n=1 Tax=Dothidotthia symphoricarpi CBS 119687 TaxID=1392245 RepID=A0A6A6AH59_9PLEO|nr:cryptochrome [Dothidotthia symphoricarpi CBS 119687]KAF2131140.1 cryptochrome [Dothidotthia symphoricarpi CBS 119687]
MTKERPRILLYILRRDVRLSDNPIFHSVSQQINQRRTSTSPQTTNARQRDDSPISDSSSTAFTHLLPVYVFPANQIEVSGFVSSPDQSPYPQARSQIAGVWRTGPHRLKFIAEGVWDLKNKLEGLQCGSGLEIRAGSIEDVVKDILEWYSISSGGNGRKTDIAGVWMTDDEGCEEKADEKAVKKLAKQHGADFKLWNDEKYYIDDRDQPFKHVSDLPNIYTSYRKSLEPLRDQPRKILPTPTKLLPLPHDIPPPKSPFQIPSTLLGLKKALMFPLDKDPTFTLSVPPKWPTDVGTSHPFEGGETSAQDRVSHLISRGAMSTYKATRNGMLGLDYSTKLSAFLAQGHLTARQIHWAMMDFEEGKGVGGGVEGYGKGENPGTAAVRFELLWRDYMRLCMGKFGWKMFAQYGIQDEMSASTKDKGHQTTLPKKKWRSIDKSSGTGDDPKKTLETFTRWRSGRTGVGLIDASNRELFLTGFTSNRARQNVASFLTSHLDIDWRIGAEWYEFMLTDYDVASNWGNWMYVAGVGNDPRQGRTFNPVKQAFDYDPHGEYIKAWVPELRGLKLTRNVGSGREEFDKQRLMGLYQAWRLSDWDKNNLGIKDVEWVEKPLIHIQFSIGRGKPSDNNNNNNRPTNQGRGRGRGGGGGGRGGGKPREFRRPDNNEKSMHSDGPTIVSSERAYT